VLLIEKKTVNITASVYAVKKKHTGQSADFQAEKKGKEFSVE